MRICYFGIYRPDLSRNKIYISGLKMAGYEVIECRDNGGRFSKYWNLWRKHRALRGQYDVMIVGYGGHVIVPFARLLTRRPLFADLLGSFADAERHSHEARGLRLWRDKFIDWLAVACADVSLVESQAQKDFLVSGYGQGDKVKVLYTGLDEGIFHEVGSVGNGRADLESEDQKERFKKRIVLFRGRLTPESGIFHILKAAELLKSKRPDISFRIIGFHYRLGEEVKKNINEKGLSNVELFYDYLSNDELIGKMSECSVALGQFESNPRLDRTIPHKIFEAMNMRLPIITGSSPAVSEILENGKSCLFVERGDAEDLADKICQVIDNPGKSRAMAEEAKKAYDKKCSNAVLIPKLVALIKEQIEEKNGRH